MEYLKHLQSVKQERNLEFEPDNWRDFTRNPLALCPGDRTAN